ncbi:hypothetical protein [Pseudoduganella violaceinigra]|uniref:hypothetical protein n=1 Tax=Pseudoduganella violaceinigra TaxID=246602 RepID=UPI0004812907|nr:hypothetical protein [Pseudoduganella violaceinigra]
MSLVDITAPPAEDEVMDPATKQYVDSNLALAVAQSEARQADFRATMQAYTARAEEREASARERDTAAREREDIRANNFERLMAAYEAKADARHQASEARFDRMEKRLDQIEASIASLKKFIVGASLSTVLGVAAFNAALIQNYHAAFDSARYLSAAEKDMMAQRQRSDALLAAMEARLAAMEKISSQKA